MAVQHILIKRQIRSILTDEQKSILDKKMSEMKNKGQGMMKGNCKRQKGQCPNLTK